jgi:hypothetical protein
MARKTSNSGRGRVNKRVKTKILNGEKGHDVWDFFFCLPLEKPSK